MKKKNLIIAFALIAFGCLIDAAPIKADTPANVDEFSLQDRNSDGYIYKGTITLTRVASGRKETFCLFNKRGVDYVSTSRRGPYYRLSHRMMINGVEYTY